MYSMRLSRIRITIFAINQLSTAQLWSELNNIPEITADTINCMGCCVDGVKTMYCSDMCAIRKCVNEKGFNTCGDCKELDNCQIVGPIFQHTPSAKENLL